MDMIYHYSKVSFLIVCLLSLLLLSGCATQALHYTINGKPKTSKQSATVIKNHFLISKIIKAELDTSGKPLTLFLCVLAKIESDLQRNDKDYKGSALKDYFMSVSVSNIYHRNNVFVEDYSIGCNNKFNPGSNRLLVSNTEIAIPAYVPRPIGNHASKFNLAQIFFVGAAGSIETLDEKNPTTMLRYKINNQQYGGISQYNIMVRTKNTIIPAKENPTEFSSKELLAVFYPFTIVWDVITTPFIFMYFYIRDIH